ncbi:MAG: hypothetical protein ABIH67_00525 [Candidatus Uhrbacteria bacterium]
MLTAVQKALIRCSRERLSCRLHFYNTSVVVLDGTYIDTTDRNAVTCHEPDCEPREFMFADIECVEIMEPTMQTGPDPF